MLESWKQLKNIIKKRVEEHQPLTFSAVANNLKELNKQARLVGKEILIRDKIEPKSKNFGYSKVEGMGDLFKD